MWFQSPKIGFGIVGDPARKIELKAGGEEVLVFQLEPKERRFNGQSQN